MVAPAQRWDVVVAVFGDDKLERLLDDGWEPFGSAATSGPDGDLFVVLRRIRSR